MTASPKKRKAAPNKSESQVRKADLGMRIVELLEAPRAQCGILLFIVAATFLLGVWTFDAKRRQRRIHHAGAQSGPRRGAFAHQLARSAASDQVPFWLSPFAGSFGVGFPGDWVPMKAWVLVLFALGMGMLYQLAKERMGALPSLAVVALSVVLGESYLTHGPTGAAYGPLLLHYAHQVMSEVPYLTFSLLALWLVERGVGREGLKGNWWLVGGFACTIWAYYIRTVGIALVAAVVVYLLLRRDFRRCLLFGGAAFVCWLPWTLRNQAVGGGSVYIKQLFMVNPYHPERGLLDLGGFVERFIGHAYRYLTRELPNTLMPFFDGTGTILHPAPLLLIALAVAATVLCIKRGEHLLLLLYAAFFMGIVLLWPWPGDRFLVPIVPVLVLLGVWIVLQIRDRLAGGNVGKLVVWGCFLACVIGQVGGVKRLADYAAADYPPPWLRYYQAGQWLKANAPADAIVLCRKGYWMYIVSGRRCVGFPFDEPAKVLAHMESEKVNYVVLESLGFSQTGQYLYPAIKEYENRFQVVWHDQPVPTYVLRFLKQ